MGKCLSCCRPTVTEQEEKDDEISLVELVELVNGDTTPLDFLVSCIERELPIPQGIYRICGNAKMRNHCFSNFVDHLKNNQTLDADDFTPVIACGVLKQVIRNLAENGTPLIPSEISAELLSCTAPAQHFRERLTDISEKHRVLITKVFEHLGRVSLSCPVTNSAAVLAASGMCPQLLGLSMSNPMALRSSPYFDIMKDIIISYQPQQLTLYRRPPIISYIHRPLPADIIRLPQSVTSVRLHVALPSLLQLLLQFQFLLPYVMSTFASHISTLASTTHLPTTLTSTASYHYDHVQLSYYSYHYTSVYTPTAVTISAQIQYCTITLSQHHLTINHRMAYFVNTILM